jgi:hypothetical protein
MHTAPRCPDSYTRIMLQSAAVEYIQRTGPLPGGCALSSLSDSAAAGVEVRDGDGVSFLHFALLQIVSFLACCIRCACIYGLGSNIAGRGEAFTGTLCLRRCWRAQHYYGSVESGLRE